MSTDGIVLRDPRPGDGGWIVQRHGRLYAEEFGYSTEFEGVVAEVVGRFLQRHDPARERCWIAERAGENVGCVMLVRLTDETAKLRLLLVEPSARGLGLGERLVRAPRVTARSRFGRTPTSRRRASSTSAPDSGWSSRSPIPASAAPTSWTRPGIWNSRRYELPLRRRQRRAA